MVGRSIQNREENVPTTASPAGPHDNDRAQVEGRALEAVFDFGQIDGPLTVKVALSGVDEAGAIANLDSEGGDFDFDGPARLNEAQWEQALGAVQIDAPPEMRTTLYTALYHALMAPSVMGDVDGRYRGPDQAVHTGRGLHLPLDLFAVGHLPRRAPAADPGPAPSSATPT
jgi:putative alpha-1,2-mannosidase